MRSPGDVRDVESLRCSSGGGRAASRRCPPATARGRQAELQPGVWAGVAIEQPGTPKGNRMRKWPGTCRNGDAAPGGRRRAGRTVRACAKSGPLGGAILPYRGKFGELVRA